MRNDDTNLIGRRFTEGRCNRLILEANNESLRAENGRLNAQVAELRAAAQIVAGAAQFTATFPPDRCRICGWPLVEKIQDGCTRKSCSQRPAPAVRADHWYAEAASDEAAF